MCICAHACVFRKFLSRGEVDADNYGQVYILLWVSSVCQGMGKTDHHEEVQICCHSGWTCRVIDWATNGGSSNNTSRME